MTLSRRGFIKAISCTPLLAGLGLENIKYKPKDTAVVISTEAVPAKGTTLKIDGKPYTHLVKSIEGPSRSTTIDITSLDDPPGYRKYIPSPAHSETVGIRLHADKELLNIDQLATHSFEIVSNDNAEMFSIEFEGAIVEINHTIDFNQLLEVELHVRVLD